MDADPIKLSEVDYIDLIENRFYVLWVNWLR